MIGRPSSRSTATPCAFIATSIAPPLAPKTNKVAASVTGLVASSGSGKSRQKISVAARVTEALDRPSRMWPVSGIETSAPAAMHSRHNPSVAFEIPKVVLQPRNVRNPRSHHRAVDREDRERRPARGHPTTTSMPALVYGRVSSSLPSVTR